jgi:hypothetical protein
MAMPYNVPFLFSPSIGQGWRESRRNVMGDAVARRGWQIQNRTAEVGGNIPYIDEWIVTTTNGLALRCASVVGERALGNGG